MFGNIKVFAGTASPALAQEIASYLNVPLSGRDIIKFPNENIFVKLHASVRGQDCYVVQTTSAPTSDNLLEWIGEDLGSEPPPRVPLVHSCWW